MIKTPKTVFEKIFAFSPNRDTLGGTAYLLLKKHGNILVDCPSWDKSNREFILNSGGVRFLAITHRGAMGKHVSQIQEDLGCEVVVQEQEAYLLPAARVTTFTSEFSLNEDNFLLWTPGHSPGSACLYDRDRGGLLFTGRHLLPISPTEIKPLRQGKTFHWFRQLQSIQLLRDRFTPQTLNYILPGANLGLLRGKTFVALAHQQLLNLDLEALRQAKPLL
jgi:hypothetical protein